ncbi:lytic transglycosylase domain-containing protein [Silanimonas sp.]|uniref:lytic transglycosylase domain-containing protein n=1 Tax=Silanimonas sp. TaxID=1929290 RepID=UPI001BC05BC3|nr:lytic transglycosylase domain-containing protein [Silanimonas sp.]MBS3896316.1 transglycosylase SLT domain-containing protein [Silanimonas sp.]MBS3923745.1 transglycosylase SLT domain-containing protein [Xanthomonadaceae bacterium]
MRRFLLPLLFAVHTPWLNAAVADSGENEAVIALYERFEAAAQAHRQAMAAVAAGEGRAARRAASRALDGMLDSAQACAHTPACDTAQLLARLDGLLGAGTMLAGEGAAAAPALEPADSPVLAAFPDAGGTLAKFNGRDLRELIVQNEAVLAAKAEWLTHLRPQLINAFEQYQHLRFLMWPEYERAGLPEALLFAILARESGGRVHAISTAGAAGLMQFMPATGQRFGLGWVDGFDTRFDPQLAARASVLYLNERFAQLGHDLELALAAYNGGEGRVGRLVRAAPPGTRFWDPAIFNALPRETRDYVPYVLAAAWLFLHAEDYGLVFPKVNGAATVLRLQQPASLNQLTICLGNPSNRYGYFRVLRNLNPRWLPHEVLPVGTELRMPVDAVRLYDQHCLEGPRATQALALVQARRPEVPASAPRVASRVGGHTVRSGDTLSSIARRHGCSAATLARANGLRSPYALRPGQRLDLAGCGGS